MAQSSFAMLTNLGRAKEAAALAAGSSLQITHIAIGDGATVPSGGETALYNEIARKTISGSGTVAGAANVAYFDAHLAADEGPYTIREAGLIDSAGDLIAIAHYNPPINKPVPSSGQTVEGTVRLEVAFSNIANVTIVVDPAMQVALQRLTTLPWIPILSMTTATPPGSPAVGDTYLIPASPTGSWSGHAGKIAEYTNAGWAMVTPKNGHGFGLPDGSAWVRISGAYVKRGQVEAAVTRSGLSFAPTDQDALAKAMRSLGLNYVVAGGTANALTATLAPAPASYDDLKFLIVLPSASNAAGGVTVKIGALAAVPVTIAGSNPPAGALTAGVPTLLTRISGGYSLVGAPTTGGLVNTREFGPGSHSYTPTAGTKRIEVTVTGGGGGGAATGGTSNFGGGGGGGAGETRTGSVDVGALTFPITVTVGGAGAGTFGGAGSNGGSSSFGSFASAVGGGGASQGGLASSAHTQNGGLGGTGGAGGTGFPGAAGQPPINFGNSNFVSGAGGSSYWGAGGSARATETANGLNAPAWGAGGGGASVLNGAGPTTGGSGGEGRIVVKEYA